MPQTQQAAGGNCATGCVVGAHLLACGGQAGTVIAAHGPARSALRALLPLSGIIERLRPDWCSSHGVGSVKGELRESLSGDLQGGASPISEPWLACQSAPWFERMPLRRGPGARSSPEAAQRCAAGAGLDGADDAHAILVRSNPRGGDDPSCPGSAVSQSSRPKPVSCHAAATAASPHIRSARQAPAP